MKEVPDSVDCLLKLNSFHLSLLLRLFFVKLGRVRLLERVIRQGLDYSHHFRDRGDDQELSVVCKHDGTSSQDDASEDSREELEESLLLDDLLDADAGVGNQTIAVDVFLLV